MKRKTVTASLTTLALTAGLALAGAPAAEADAYGCHADVCVNVLGHSNYVGKVTVYLDLTPRQAASGRFYVLRDRNVERRSSERHYKNQSYFHSHRWAYSYTFDEYLFKGEKVCGKFVDGGNKQGHYGDILGEACETVG